MHSNGPHQTQEQMILGRSLGHHFQHQNGNGASPMFYTSKCENQSNKNQWHSVLQTPVHHKPAGHTWNTRHKGGIGPHKCIISRNGETAEALQKFSKLFTKIAAAKSELAKAIELEQQNNLQNHPNARWAVPLPRVAKRPPTPASQLWRVPIEIAEADCRVISMPMQTVEGRMPRQGTRGQPAMRPNYISQDEDDNKPNHRYHTRSRMTSIMQEAMLACINITKPKFEIQQPNWLPENSRWNGFAKWPTLSLASKVTYWNTNTWLPIPKHGPHGPALMEASSDGWHKECQAKWLERTQFFSSQRTRYCKQGQWMSGTASSPASSGQRKPMSQTKQDF